MFAAMVSVTAQDEDGSRRVGSYRPGYERVAEQILELIADSGLRPGDRMPTENDLAARVGTSRTVVREAVKILSAIGRVSVQKGRGLFVEGRLKYDTWDDKNGGGKRSKISVIVENFQFLGRGADETEGARHSDGEEWKTSDKEPVGAGAKSNKPAPSNKRPQDLPFKSTSNKKFKEADIPF